MEHLPIPPDEEERLEDLRRLDLALSEPEELFDRITRELVRIFRVGGVALSFAEREVFYVKSASGPLTDGGPPTEPRELAMCNIVISTNDLVVVEDLLADERYCNHPIVVDSGARFYAGAPLRSESGRAVGSLCIVDREPRTLGERERELLRLVADGAMAQIRLRVASRRLIERTKEVERDLALAQHVQRFMLPPESVMGPGFRITSIYRPYEQLGGDFVDLHRRVDGTWAILVADVTGHGTSAALVSAMLKTAFQRAATRALRPADILSALERELAGSIGPGRFVTAIAAIFDPLGKRVRFASAGHPLPILVSGDRSHMIDHENEMMLLVEPDREYEGETAVGLRPGDRLLVYTDGAIEGRDPMGAALGADGLLRHAHETAAEGEADFLAALLGRIRRHAHDRLRDDVAMICVEVDGDREPA